MNIQVDNSAARRTIFVVVVVVIHFFCFFFYISHDHLAAGIQWKEVREVNQAWSRYWSKNPFSVKTSLSLSASSSNRRRWPSAGKPKFDVYPCVRACVRVSCCVQLKKI